jgi:hypothetical protein
VFSSVYGPKLVEGLRGLPIPGNALAAAKDSMAAAVAVAHQAPTQAQPVISHVAQSAFTDGLAFGSLVAAAAAAIGAVVALVFLPARARASAETTPDNPRLPADIEGIATTSAVLDGGCEPEAALAGAC